MSQFLTKLKIPMLEKPTTDPAEGQVYFDIFSIQNTIRMLLQYAVEDAPSDGLGYIRKDGQWVEGVEEAPADGKIYGRKDKAWEQVTGGGGGSNPWEAPYVAPPETGWSWLNQGTSSIVSTPTKQLLNIPAKGSGFQQSGRSRPLPSGAYTLTARLHFLGAARQYLSAGIGLRESSTGRLHLLDMAALANGSNISVRIGKCASPTGYNADYLIFTSVLSDPSSVWLRIRDDGTNRISYISADGVNWIQVHSVARADYLNPNECYFGGSAENNNATQWPNSISLVSWEITQP